MFFSAVSNPTFQISGKERDETNLDWFENRYLSTIQGRWTSPDPTLLSVNGFNPQTWNRYNYVLNNPLRFIDPNGLWQLDWRRIGNDALIWAVKEDGDTGATLAEQLHLTGDYASQIAEYVDGLGTTKIRLASLPGTVGELYRNLEERYSSQLRGEHSEHHNCAQSALELFLNDNDYKKIGTFELDEEIRDRGLRSVPWDEANIGAIVRYADRNNIPLHFTTLIFSKKDGTPIVFSKSGKDDAPFTYGEAKEYQGLQGNTYYGNIKGIWMDKYGVYDK